MDEEELRPGDEAPKEMETAMETADIHNVTGVRVSVVADEGVVLFSGEKRWEGEVAEGTNGSASVLPFGRA